MKYAEIEFNGNVTRIVKTSDGKVLDFYNRTLDVFDNAHYKIDRCIPYEPGCLDYLSNHGYDPEELISILNDKEEVENVGQ